MVRSDGEGHRNPLILLVLLPSFSPNLSWLDYCWVSRVMAPARSVYLFATAVGHSMLGEVWRQAKAVWGRSIVNSSTIGVTVKPVRLLLFAVCGLAVAGQAFGPAATGHPQTGLTVTSGQDGAGTPPWGDPGDGKMEPAVRGRAHAPNGRTQVIITMRPGTSIDDHVAKGGGRLGRYLEIIHARVAEVSDGALLGLAHNPNVVHIDLDRPVAGQLDRTAAAVGAKYVRENYGYTGAGVGVAVIDSGISPWLDDMTPSYAGSWSYGSQRVLRFVDFVGARTTAYDDYGHGTHVAGIIAGNGYDSANTRIGMAPAAHLVVLKVLDGNGVGRMSDVIAAIDYAVSRKSSYNIRVINLSIGAPISQSYKTDPLTLAAKRAVDAGIVVVASAGNFGQNASHQPQYGGITAPGNAPWVITVGASSHGGTTTRTDDTIAPYSSRGPTYLDYIAKPDLVAPGTGIASLSAPGSYLFNTRPAALLSGRVATPYRPYESLSGTSMAAPVVTGTVALMLQANPALTPNAVKAILEYSAEFRSEYNYLTQGAGFLNARGAVRLARYFANPSAGITTADMKDYYQSSYNPFWGYTYTAAYWGRHVLWGNYHVSGGMIMPAGNAWASNIVWGSAATATGDNIVWGSACDPYAGCDNIVWGSVSGDNIVWGSNGGDNIVWGNASGDDNIVWGSSCGGGDCDNIVWGSTTISATGDNIVWGSADAGDNIVWGSACDASTGCDNIVWGSADGDNIVWGSSVDVIEDVVIWGECDVTAGC